MLRIVCRLRLIYVTPFDDNSVSCGPKSRSLFNSSKFFCFFHFSFCHNDVVLEGTWLTLNPDRDDTKVSGGKEGVVC